MGNEREGKRGNHKTRQTEENKRKEDTGWRQKPNNNMKEGSDEQRKANKKRKRGRKGN